MYDTHICLDTAGSRSCSNEARSARPATPSARCVRRIFAGTVDLCTDRIEVQELLRKRIVHSARCWQQLIHTLPSPLAFREGSLLVLREASIRRLIHAIVLGLVGNRCPFPSADALDHQSFHVVDVPEGQTMQHDALAAARKYCTHGQDRHARVPACPMPNVACVVMGYARNG